MTNALFALDAGWHGQGVLVGVIDDGVLEVGDLRGKVHTSLSKDFGGTLRGGQLTARNDISNDRASHGTAVAALIAGKRDGLGMQGLAPGAQIVVLRTDYFNEDKGAAGYGINLDRVVNYANANRIPILNMSISKDFGPPTRALVDAMVAYNRDTRGLLVNSAGNSRASGPGYMVEVNKENEQSWLFVVALEPSLQEFKLASYSNTCGLAMNRCVAAVGQHTTMALDGSTRQFGGTSAAAPQVAALAATILSKWPQLTGVDAGNIIVNTARDLGAPGVDEIYGHGLIDFDAALRPVNPVLSNGRVTTGIAGTTMILGGAFSRGNRPSSVEQGMSDVLVLDQYGRDFSASLAGMVLKPAVDRAGLTRQIEAQAQAGQAGFVSPQGSAVVGYTALGTGMLEGGQPVLRNQITNARLAVRLGSGMSVMAGFNSGQNVMDDMLGLAPTSDVMFAYAPVAQTSFGLGRQLGRGELAVQAYSGQQQDLRSRGLTASYRHGLSMLKLGVTDEQGTVFGTPVGFGLMRFGDGAQSVFVEASSGFVKGKWAFDGYVSLGATRLRLSDDMLITDASAILTNRFGMFARRPLWRGRLSLGMAQEMIAVAGNADFALARHYDQASRSLIYSGQQIDLSGRMRPRIALGYEQSGERSSFQMGAVSDPQARDVRAIASWQVRF